MKEGQRVDTKHVSGQVALILWGQPERKAELCPSGKDCNKKRDLHNEHKPAIMALCYTTERAHRMTSLALEDYISEEQKREIAEQAFRHICEDKFRVDAERIFSNAAYKAVWRVVDDMFDGKAAQMVADKIPEIIENLNDFSVFRYNGYYGQSESVGFLALKSAVESQKEALEARVAALAGEVSKQDVINMLLDSDITLKISANQDGAQPCVRTKSASQLR